MSKEKSKRKEVSELQLAYNLSFTGTSIKVKPFLKWAGGKTQLLPELRKYIPDQFHRYIEPMVGAGAMFFDLQPENAILADSNEELINAYIVVRDNVNELIKMLKKYVNNEEFYLEIRSQNISELTDIQRAARLIYLNKTCFNGLYRVNKQGQFNVPFGHRKNPKICDEYNLRAASKVLATAKIIHGDYLAILGKYAQPGDFIFLDPPYHPVGAYSDFKRYTKEFFYEEDHIALRDEVDRLVKNGCYVLLTNSSTEFVRKLYDGYNYVVVDTKRNISSKVETRTGQDLIVLATKPKVKTKSLLALQGKQILENFPGTRYMGSKYRVLPFIWDSVKDLRFDSVLDAFSGSACVSYMFKQQGKRVVSNDFMKFAYHISKALIENQEVTLSDDDKKLLLSANRKAGSFIADTFAGLYFTDEENHFLDVVRANIELLDDEYKKSLALSALTRACMKRRPRGIFTYTGERYDDGRRDMQINLRQHFIENIDAFNKAVFNNSRCNMALGLDVFQIHASVDLVYLDPPYFTSKSDNDYSRRYHFVEGLVRQWEGVEIQHDTVTKKFKRYETLFYSKDTINQAFEKMFEKFRDQIIVLSYSSNSLPDKSDLMELLNQYKKHVKVHQIEHTYSFGNQNHKIGNNANKVQEYIFIAK